MTVQELQEQVSNCGGYQTAAERRRRPLPGPLATPIFHLMLVAIIWHGSWKARRADFEEKEWGKFCQRLLRLTEGLGGSVTFENFERVRNTDFPVVWVANHVSSLETYLLPLLLTHYSRLLIVLKESLAHYPLFGRVVRAIDPIRVQRRSALHDLRAVLRKGTEGLANGRSVLIFPQGQRFETFDPDSFNTLGVRLAQNAGVPLVPVAVRTDFLRLGRWFKELATVRTDRPVRISCGDPIPAGTPPDRMQAAAVQFIVGELARWQRESPVPLLAPAAESLDPKWNADNTPTGTPPAGLTV